MRSKRPMGAPRWAADAESARPGEDLEGVDRDFGQRLWAETLDRDFGQRLWTDLMPESSTLVPGGAADPPPRSARRREWGFNSRQPVAVPVPVPMAVPVVFGVFL